MRASHTARADPTDLTDGGVAGKSENVEKVVHDAEPSFFRDSACPEREAKFAMGTVVERIEVERTVAFVAEQFHQGRAALLLGRLQLGIGYPKQVHLQRLD
jgi:hypothetical protein